MAQFTIRGDKKVRAFLMSIAKTTPVKLGAAVYHIGNEIMTESKKRTPVDLGALKGSGQIDAPKITPKGASVRMGYGDSAVDYALIVHEDTEAFHKIGQSHYLSSVIDEWRPHFLRRVAARTRVDSPVTVKPTATHVMPTPVGGGK